MKAVLLGRAGSTGEEGGEGRDLVSAVVTPLG
jgi:hypothetical protein